MLLTSLPLIYLQRPRHSLTIVGLERRRDGSRALLIFDPAYAPITATKRVLSEDAVHTNEADLMEPHLHGERYLARHSAFEILRLLDTLPLSGSAPQA